MQQITAVLIIVVLLTVGIGGYFFWQNSVARSELAVTNKEIVDLKETNLKVESELILLKSSDLAKDLELPERGGWLKDGALQSQVFIIKNTPPSRCY